MKVEKFLFITISLIVLLASITDVSSRKRRKHRLKHLNHNYEEGNTTEQEQPKAEEPKAKDASKLQNNSQSSVTQAFPSNESDAKIAKHQAWADVAKHGMGTAGKLLSHFGRSKGRRGKGGKKHGRSSKNRKNANKSKKKNKKPKNRKN